MSQANQSTELYLLSEDFEMPDCNVDLLDLIEVSLHTYYELGTHQKLTKQYRDKINYLVDEYNERRGCKIMNHVK